MNRASEILAAHLSIRQVELILRADAAAAAADREIGAVWQALLAVLRETVSPWEARRRAVEILRTMAPRIRARVAGSLVKVGGWAHRSAVAPLRALPLPYLRAAAHMTGALVPVPGTSLSADRALITRLLFPPIPVHRVYELLNRGPDPWHRQLERATRLADPEVLGGAIARGYALGETQRELARRLQPVLDGVRVSARRIARTESMRIGHAVQMDAHRPLEPLFTGYQIHATLDHWTRSWHAHRDGTIYYLRPAPGDKGPYQMPHPPEEAQDRRERPAGTPQTAYHCRCFLTPVLAALAHLKGQEALFYRPGGQVVPDPLTYSAWFREADERRRRLAVGTARYSLAKEANGGRPPAWEHFLDPDTGSLLPAGFLKHETGVQRLERVAKVRATLRERERLGREVAIHGGPLGL